MKNNYNTIHNASLLVFQKWAEDPSSLTVKELKLLTSSAQKLITFNIAKVKSISANIEHLKSVRDKSNNLYRKYLNEST